MERFLNLFKFKIAPIFISVVILVSLPLSSFPSHALEATTLGYLTYEAYLALSSYLVSKGYSAPKIAHSDGDVIVDSSNSFKFMQSFFDTVEFASDAQKVAFQKALSRAASSGVFSISSDMDSYLTQYFQSVSADSSLVLGSTTDYFYPFESSEVIDYSITFVDSSLASSPSYSVSTSISIPYDYLPIINYDYSTASSGTIMLIFLPVNPITSYSAIMSAKNASSISNSSSYSGLDYQSDLAFGSISSNRYYLFARFSFNPGNLLMTSFLHSDYLTSTSDVITALLSSIQANLEVDGYYSSSSNITSSEIYDTSDTDILSSASEVDSLGNVTGGYTQYLKDLSLLQDIISQFTQGVLSYSAAIKALGLSTVSKSATAEEKESALDNVAYPDSTYDWFSSTTWGDTVTQSVNDELDTVISQEQSLSDSVAEDLASGSGQSPSDDDLDRAGQSMLLATLLMWLGIWKPPSFDPDNPDPGGVDSDPSDDDFDSSDYLGDTLGGVAVVSGFITDIFDSAGGSSGFGIIFTVGATFVIFSVLIGAANYFGVNDVHTTSVTVQKPPKIKRLALPDKKGK